MGLASILLSALTFCVTPDQVDTLRPAAISATYGSLVVPQRISSGDLKTASGLSEAIRRFAGVQLRDYGGVGGLKTVNVRSLGSEHTGVFIDGIQVDNAQNMQVDLGRFSLEGLSSVSLFSGQKVSHLQSAKEYSSASSLYLESAEPVFTGGKRDNFALGIGAGSFMTLSPSALWEHFFRGGSKLKISGGVVSSGGRYRFHVKDFRQFPDGSLAGYDTVMTRTNCDLTSVRTEASLYGHLSGKSSWSVKAYFYGSGRGLPGPVYKRAGDYPLSQDRQRDRDAFVQARYQRDLGEVWSVAGRAKLSYNHLEYLDYPELMPQGTPADYNYRNHSAYASASAMAKVSDWLKVNLAQDIQYDYLDSDLRDFAYPGRLSSWSCVSTMFHAGALDLSVSALYLSLRDSFLSGERRSSAARDAFMPSFVFKLKVSDGLSFNGFAKRSFRMPTFNDLYYTTVGAKTLEPEDAVQVDLGADWTVVKTRRSRLAFKTDFYRNQLRNKIIAVPTSNQFRWSMYNLGKVEVLGADLTTDYSLRSGKTVFGALARYTFQRSIDKSDRGSLSWGGQIPYIPLHSGSLNLSVDYSGWRSDLTFFAMGDRYTTSANLPAYRLEPWLTLDAAISKSLSLRSGAIDLKLTLRNLLDRQYEIVDNYPMPGTSFMLSVCYCPSMIN